jgi:hypothetical protein
MNDPINPDDLEGHFGFWNILEDESSLEGSISSNLYVKGKM